LSYEPFSADSYLIVIWDNERILHIMDEAKFAMLQSELNREFGVSQNGKGIWAWIRGKITRD